MTTYPTEAEARAALQGADEARRRVIDRFGLPWWYWWGLAGCWIGLGLLSDLAATVVARVGGDRGGRRRPLVCLPAVSRWSAADERGAGSRGRRRPARPSARDRRPPRARGR